MQCNSTSIRRSIYEGREKPIAIIFSSIDQTIHFAAVCYRSDPFSKVEKELYKEYPELKNKKFCFLFGGGTINRDGTLEALFI